MGKITYEELIGILCNLASRLAVAESLLLDRINQDEFITYEVLKTRADVYSQTNKTPFKRLDELEQNLKGYIAYSQDKLVGNRRRHKDEI